MLTHIPVIMPCITPGKKTLKFSQLAIGSMIGSLVQLTPKANIWTILAHTATMMTFMLGLGPHIEAYRPQLMCILKLSTLVYTSIMKPLTQ